MLLFAACSNEPSSPSSDAGSVDSQTDAVATDSGSSDSGGTDAGSSDAGTSALPWLGGVSLAGAEFGSNVPGTYGTDYTYPTTAEVDYFVGKGMRVLRIPFLWERLQPTLNMPLDATELGRLDAVVTYALGKGAHVVLDPHNYARYSGNVVGSVALPNSALADLWTRLATQWGPSPNVIFAIMNEPNTMPTEQWLSAANAAIAAIRATGATNLVLVPGNAWTGAHSWADTWYGSSNATVMLGVVDSANRYAYEVHQYLDADSSGTATSCVSTTIGSQRLAAFTAWLVANGKRGFLGELGGGRNATCYAAVDDMLDHLDAHRDVWVGFTVWAAGPWWGAYEFSLEPNGAMDAPLMPYVSPHL